jgi:hypothetical protein
MLYFGRTHATLGMFDCPGKGFAERFAAPAAMCSSPGVLTQVYCIIETMIKMQECRGRDIKSCIQQH